MRDARESYARQLRTDSIFLVIPVATVAAILFSTASFFIQSDLDSTVAFITLTINILLPLFIAQASWRNATNERIERAAYLLIISHLLLITLNFAQATNITSSFLPYWFSFFIVVSSTLIEPRASLRTWGTSVLLTISVIIYRSLLDSEISFWSTFFDLLDPIMINGLLAVASYITKIDWEMAVYEASEANVRSQKQRDEWFQAQEELRQINARQEFLYKELSTSMAVGQRITAILDIDKLLEQVAILIQEQLTFAYVGILLLDEEEEVLEVKAQQANEYSQTVSDIKVALDAHNTISQAASLRTQVEVADISTVEYTPHPYLLRNVRSEAGFPLVMGGRLLGVLNVQSYSVNAFDERALQMLQLLADQVAVAINNAMLYRQQQIRYQLTATMNEIQRAISQTLELDQVLDLILENLETLVSYNRAAVFLHRRQQDSLEMVASRGFPETSQTISIALQERDDVFLQIYRSKAPLSLPDVTLHPSWTNVNTLPSARAWLGVPLSVDDRVIGMLSLAREVRTPYTKEDEELATTFAAQAAVALANARLYNDLKTLSQELELKVALRTKELRETNDQLTQLDKAKSDFIAVTSHELRTPLTVLKGYSDILSKDKGIQENSYYKQLVEGIYSGSVRMHEVVNDMLDVVKLDNEEFNIYPETITVSEIVKAIKRYFDQALQERRIQLELNNIDVIPPLEADPDAIKKVLRHLVNNAIKYTPDGGAVTITAEPFDPAAVKRANLPADFEGIHLIVTDTGIGIDPIYQEAIFTKFYQTGEVALHSSGKIKFKGGGPGLGLAIADGIMKAHGGALWVESSGHDEATLPGSRFHIVLPLKPTTETVPAD